MTEATRGRWMILLAGVLWSTSGAFVKIADMPELTVAMYRSLCAGIFLVITAWICKTRFTWHPLMLPMVIVFALMNYTFIASMTKIHAADTILLQYTAPLWMFFGSVFWLRERYDRRNLLAIIGCMVGIAIVLLGKWGTGAEDRWGVVLGLLSGVTFAGIAVFLRYLRAHDALWLAALNHLGAGLLLMGAAWIGSIWHGGHSTTLWQPRPGQLALLAVFGICQMATPYLLFGLGLRSLSPQEAGLISLVEPLLNPVWTYFVAGEQPFVSTLIGGGIMILMLMVRYFPSSHSSASVNRS